MLSFRTTKSKSKSDRSTENGDADDANAKVKKSKSFKRIRGLLKPKGETRKERRARKAAERAARREAGGATTASAAASNADADNDEASTVFGVDVEDRSVLGNATGNNAANNAAVAAAGSFLKTPETPGDNKSKAYILKVVLLLMDPETRRFELLQLEFDSNKALVSDVLAQIPVSVTEEALRVQNYTGIAGKDGIEMAPSRLLAAFCQGNEVLVAVPEGVAPKECARLARPILSDEKVVNMLASSGIDATGWKDDKKKKKKSAMKSSSRNSPDGVNAAAAASSAGSTPGEETTSTTGKSSSGASKVFTLLFIILLAILLQVFHVYVSAPIKPGHTVSPGVWLSKCGLLSVLPSCENEYLHFSKDGLVTHYNAAKEITWQMEGTKCTADDNENCKDGLILQDDGKVIIGGKPVAYLTSFVKDAVLEPWPFEEAPKLKVWKK